MCCAGPRPATNQRSKAATFFKATGGSLTLENLDLAVLIPETPGRRWTLLHGVDADLTVTGCTFSQAGKGASDPLSS